MATQAELLGAAGPGTKVTVNGQTFTLIRSTKRIQAEWGAWLLSRAEERAHATAARYRKDARKKWDKAKSLTRSEIGDATWLEMGETRQAEIAAERDELKAEAAALEQEAVNVVERFNDRAAAGEFEFTGNVGIQLAQRNLAGIIHLAWLCLLPHHPKLTHDELVELFKGEKNTQKWMEAILKSEGALKNGPSGPAADGATGQKGGETTCTTQ